MSRALGILRSFAFAAPLLFPVFACSSAEDAEIVTSCTSSAQCPIGAACARPKGKCVPEPYPGVLGTFQCTLGDKAVDPRSATAFGTSDVVGKIDALPAPSGTGGAGGAGSAGAPAESPGTDRIALVSRTVCYVEKGLLVIRQTDAGETLGQDSFELETFISQATYEKKSPLTGVPWPVDDVSLRKYLQYTQTSVKHGYSVTGYVLFDQVPTIGKPLSGYLEIQDLQLDPDAGPQPNAGGAGGAAGKSGAAGASGGAGKGGAAGTGGAAGASGASGKGGSGGAAGKGGASGAGGTSGAAGTAGKGGSSGTSGASGSSGTSGASGSSGTSGASGSSGTSGASGSSGTSGASGSSGASGAGAGGAGSAGASGSAGAGQGGTSGAAGAAGDAGSGGT